MLGRLARSYPRQRKEGYYYETDDFHASPVSAQMKPCDQDWGKENLDVSGAVPLPENNCIIPYMWYPVNEKTQLYLVVGASASKMPCGSGRLQESQQIFSRTYHGNHSATFRVQVGNGIFLPLWLVLPKKTHPLCTLDWLAVESTVLVMIIRHQFPLETPRTR